MTDHAGPPRFPWEDDEAADDAADGDPQRAGKQADEAVGPEQGQVARTGASAERPAGARPARAGGTEPAPARRPEAGQRPLVQKEYYSIGEVADLVGLPAHVLRYWESQFSVLNPSKNRSGNRVYQRKEIRLILLVKKLLHDEKYTVEGARQKLEQLRRGADLVDATSHALDDQLVQVLRDDLLAVSELLRVDTD